MSEYSKYDTLILERHGNVGWLLNNRPDRLNALNPRLVEELHTRGRTQVGVVPFLVMPVSGFVSLFR